jgi:carrier-protein-independent halogenase WelO5-like protein
VIERGTRAFPALAEGRIPAVIVRGAYPPDQCREVVRRLYERAGIQERSGQAYDAVGTSLVNLGADPDTFFRSAGETHALYGRLFSGLIHPVERVYEILAALAPDREVMTAREPDGRLYGPAIFRLYPAGKGHPPHFDSLRLREGWSHYAVSRFEHQFAGVLCLQASDDPGVGEAILHRRFWTPALQPVLQAGRFHDYAAKHGIERTCIRLETGDFYVFNPRNVHEVPLITGATPRIVLATFLGFSADDPEVYVWS